MNISTTKVKKLLMLLLFSTLMLLTNLTRTALWAQTGTVWTSQNTTTTNQWYSVVYGNGVFVAIASSGTGNRVMTSPDGVTWTIGSSAVDNNWSSVTFGSGLFVAVAYSGVGNRVMTSSDGIAWTIRSSAADNNWRCVTYGNGLFVAVANSGNGNRVMTSPDGIAWTIRSSAADNGWQSVKYGNSLFVAVANTGTGNRVMTSADGIAWTIRSSAADNSWYGLIYGSGLFVAVSASGVGNRVMTSADGTAWTIRSFAADNGWNSIAYGNGLFAAVAYTGTGNRVMTSPDGTAWTIGSSAANNSWYGITYANGIFVAVSSDGTNRVMTSGTFVVMPVRLLSFVGKNNGGVNLLNWQTASESNSQYFDIERSRTGTSFGRIGTVAAAGNSTATKSYLFEEKSPLDGITYYRLKQVDKDGQFTYSTTMAINTKYAIANQVSVYPNPVSTELNISAGNANVGTVAQLYSIDGRLLKVVPITKALQQVNIAALPANTYLFKLADGSTIKWVKE